MTSSAPPGTPAAHYTQPTEDTFKRAVEVLRKKVPHHHAALVALLAEGRFHEPDELVAALAGGRS